MRASVHFDRKTNTFVGLGDVHLKELSEAFKGVDIEAELMKMTRWLTTVGTKRKGTMQFILNWLGNATPSKHKSTFEDELASPLQSLLDVYLQELWKNRQHILECNTIRI